MSSKLPGSVRLAGDSFRGHRRGILAWVLGGAVAMVAIAAGFRSEVARFAGGAEAMAESMQGGVQAMRLLRWPADRLDSLGGYLTYHNVTLFVLFLTLYGAVQGVAAVRGAEAGHSVEVLLSTGRSRAQLVRDRAFGFVLALAGIGMGLGAGLAVAMAIGGEPDPKGSFLTASACVACAFVGYGFGAVIGEVGGTPRSSSAAAALIVVIQYLSTNVWERLGPLAVVRFASPFYYFDRGRALVPGAGFDVLSVFGSLAAAVLLVGAATWIFEHRDVGDSLWTRSPRHIEPVERVQRPALARLWSATLMRERVGLVVWSVAAAAGLGLMAWLEPEVIDMWDKFDITRRMMLIDPGISPGDQYLAFVSEFTSPIVAAFVVTQAAGWVGDLEQGRQAMLLSTPLSPTGLIRQRLIALLAGTTIVLLVATAGLVLGTWIVGADVEVVGLVRVVAGALLLASGLGAVAAWLVVSFRKYAVMTLALALGLSYLFAMLVPMFDWPSWITRVSLFSALGHPYLQVPAWGGPLFLVALAVLGSAIAVASAGRATTTG